MRSPLRCVITWISGLALSAISAATVRGDDPTVVFLSDPRADVALSSSQAWGELGWDAAVRPIGREGAPLRIGDQTFPRGLGHHAHGEITADLGGRFRSFDAVVGVQRQDGNTVASVVFQVFVDGRKAFDSGVMRENDPPRAVSVPTQGADELRLVVQDAGDGITCDCADWAMARLTRDPDVKLEDRRRIEVNVAPFGRILSWDPARIEGTRATRVGEFPAEDVEPGRSLAADPNGLIAVPDAGGRACVGLQWPESRSLRRLEIEFGDAANAPAEGAVAAETWVGESAWQGRWAALEGSPRRVGSRLVWETSGPSLRTPTPKVRWVFPSGGRSVTVKAVAAYTRSRWKADDLRVERLDAGVPRSVAIEVYNGDVAGGPGTDPHRIAWNAESPLGVRVIACASRADKTDRTVLRFAPGPDGFGGFGIAVEDVRAHGSVSYQGIRVSTGDGKGGADARVPAVTPGVSADIRGRPDATLETALATVHRDIQNLGPMMLSLACDNRKIVADREGDVHFNGSNDVNDKEDFVPNQWRLQVRPGPGGPLAISRRLRGGWLPIPETTSRAGSIVYRQATFVAPLDEAQPDRPERVRDRAIGVVELTIGNEGETPADAQLALSLTGAAAVARTDAGAGAGRTVFQTDDRVLAIADGSSLGTLQARETANGLTLAGTLAPKSSAKCVVLVPLRRIAPGEQAIPKADTPWEDRTVSYWKSVLGPSMQVDLPDPFLNDLIRASQVHCLLAARSEDSGRRVAAWISSDRYGPLESEAHAVIRGMDFFGHDDFARRSLDYFIKRYSPEGFLTTGYTLVGTGEHLWTLAEHVDRTRNREWLRRNAAELKRVCAWIARERAKTKLSDQAGRKSPSHGLMPPGVSADWNRYAYRFFNDAQYCAGLTEVARVLATIADPDAPAIAEEARSYREDLLAAYRWTQARSPILALGDGRWAAAQPALLDSFGLVEEFQPGEDGNRSWAYSVEIGAHQLAATGMLDPTSAEVGAMLEYLEGSSFLRSGMGEYREEDSRKDPYGLGGFSKVQPFYARVAEVYAARDEVKLFLRSYFNALASLVSYENLSLWEHFHNMGGWNKTHETGWLLCQTRLMLVQERGDDLWLAPMITDRWLENGKTITVRDAPTRFGKVGYALRSHVGEGRIEALVTPPAGPDAPRKIVLRLRNPEGKPIRGVTVSGNPHPDFDPVAGTITLPVPASRSEQAVIATY